MFGSTRRRHRVDAVWITALVVMALGAGLVVVTGTVIAVRHYQRTHVAANHPLPMTHYTPTSVGGSRDVAYGSAAQEKLDVWFPDGVRPDHPLPTVVWVHGGGWISGDKSYVGPYLQILAARGFTTVGINYSLAPKTRYPTQVDQVNKALGYLKAHATTLGIDPSQIVLAGDSGGAQIAAQVAALTTNPALASDLDIVPALQPSDLSGTLLASGTYDIAASVKLGGHAADYVDAYLGTTTDKTLLERSSVTNHVTKQFPPTWVTGGDADPLTPQAKTFTQKLKDLGVPVTTVFKRVAPDPPLIHEYQFNLALKTSQAALRSAEEFLDSVTG